MKQLRISLFIMCLCGLCMSLGARPKKRVVPVKVACIGNSVTYGTGLENPEADSYPTQLQGLLGPGFEVGRFGKPGATLLRRAYRPYMDQAEFKEALAFRPDIAVIHLGLNDTDPRAWPAYRDDFMGDYLALIDSVKASNPKCRFIIAKMSPLSDRHRRFESGTRDWHAEIQQYIENVARITGSQLIDFYEPLHCHPDWFPDAIHPNKEGYGVIAGVVASAITGDFGGLQLPKSYTDHMVLPRNRVLNISGKANAGEVVALSIDKQRHTATTDIHGNWTITLEPLAQGGPYEMKVSTESDHIVLHDVMVGEVWLCTGQSNMEFMLRQTATAKEDIAGADNERIRLLNYQGRWVTYDYQFSQGALDSINHLQYYKDAQWQRCEKATAASFSAIGYYFAKALSDSLECPVGVICNAVGGSGIEAWVDRVTMENEFPAVLRDWTRNDFLQEWVRGRALRNMGEKRDRLQRHPYEPCYLYEASIRELCHYPISGVIWYQGESNAHNKDAHARLFDMLVRSWRGAWQQPEMPFYYVQLSSLNRPEWTWFRDSQRQLLPTLPHLGMAVCTDIGDSLDVHPRHKRPLGERLARWALHDAYGREDVVPSGPLVSKAEWKDDRVAVTFAYGEGLTTSDKQALRTFEVAETEGLYYPAQATIYNNKVYLTSEKVARPRYVRYGWQPFTRANLVNGEQLPASTFRIEVE